MSLCECKEPEVYIEGNTTKYYACKKCNKPVSDENAFIHLYIQLNEKLERDIKKND